MICRPGAGGEESREVFEAAMKTVDATFQNLDSSEISLTDVSHYFDSDPTKLVAGLRPDGKMPNAYIADTTTANAQVPHLPIPPLPPRDWSLPLQPPLLAEAESISGRHGTCSDTLASSRYLEFQQVGMLGISFGATSQSRASNPPPKPFFRVPGGPKFQEGHMVGSCRKSCSLSFFKVT